MIHQAVHVIVLVGFLGAMAVAFLGGVAPLLGDRTGPRLPALRASILLAAGAAGGFALDWVVHQWF